MFILHARLRNDMSLWPYVVFTGKYLKVTCTRVHFWRKSTQVVKIRPKRHKSLTLHWKFVIDQWHNMTKNSWRGGRSVYDICSNNRLSFDLFPHNSFSWQTNKKTRLNYTVKRGVFSIARSIAKFADFSS